MFSARSVGVLDTLLLPERVVSRLPLDMQHYKRNLIIHCTLRVMVSIKMIEERGAVKISGVASFKTGVAVTREFFRNLDFRG
jgi:hypothetical protein